MMSSDVSLLVTPEKSKKTLALFYRDNTGHPYNHITGVRGH